MPSAMIQFEEKRICRGISVYVFRRKQELQTLLSNKASPFSHQANIISQQASKTEQF
jgi:hypothetical protein